MNRILATLVNGHRVTQPFAPLPAARTARTQTVIVGGGTAGAIAAATAAERGLQAILVEPHTFLGGVGTGGGINSYYHGAKGGVQDRIDAETHTLDVAISVSTRGFHPDAKKAALDARLVNSSVEVRYRTRLTGVILEGAKVVGVRVASQGEQFDLLAPVTIDCSGDADVAALAGAAFRMGRPLDGLPQPYSAPCGYLYEGKSISGRNFDAGYVIPHDGADLSRALMAGHRQHLVDEFTAQNRMTYLAPHLGLREGRFIVGDATVSFRDLIDTRRYDDVVFETRAHYDNHARDWAFESDEARDWVVVCGFWSCPLKGDVPYGALLPREIDGVLVACRGISITHDSAQSFRMQGDMQKLGEVAATAAQLAVAAGVTPRQVNRRALQEALVASGCLDALPEPGRGIKRDTPFNTDPAAIRQHLVSTVPGPGLWCAGRVCTDAIVPHLVEWLQNADPNLAAHAALALGLRGRAEAVPALCGMVQTRDAAKATGGHFTQPRWFAAMYLLEKLKAAAGFEVLAGVLQDATVEPRAQAFALRALLAIGDGQPAERDRAAKVLLKLVAGAAFAPMLELQVSTAGKPNREPLRPLFELTIADALVRWDNPAAEELLSKYEQTGGARERHFVATIRGRGALVAVGA
ncbi:MAG TPA: FAD-dependent oxidoreductase [Planctomycetota bacterium]|nr:FAD-dependent oxidoreductase [Planctomycetota bacterium]